MAEENRALERNQHQREKVRADVEIEQRREQLSARPTATSVDDSSASVISKPRPEQHTALDLSHDFKEADRRVEPKTANGVAEVIIEGIDPELMERVRSRSAEAETSELPVEKKQKEAKRKEQPRQRQKKRVKERDLGM